MLRERKNGHDYSVTQMTPLHGNGREVPNGREEGDRHCSLCGTRAGRQHLWLSTKEEQDFNLKDGLSHFPSATRVLICFEVQSLQNTSSAFLVLPFPLRYSRISLSMSFSIICVQKVKVEVTGRRKK